MIDYTKLSENSYAYFSYFFQVGLIYLVLSSRMVGRNFADKKKMTSDVRQPDGRKDT